VLPWPPCSVTDDTEGSFTRPRPERGRSGDGVFVRGGLAFEESGLLDRAKLGMLQASQLATVLGASALEVGCLLKPICWLHQKMVQSPKP
jgi:hypothetical protein